MPILKQKAKALPAVKKKTTTKPAATEPAAAKPKRVHPRTSHRNEYGIAIGSDQEAVLNEMIVGGADKHEIVERCNRLFAGRLTSGGKPKAITTVVNQVIRRMTEKGFVVESYWRIVPPSVGGWPEKTDATPRKTIPRSVAKKADKPTRKLSLPRKSVAA